MSLQPNVCSATVFFITCKDKQATYKWLQEIKVGRSFPTSRKGNPLISQTKNWMLKKYAPYIILLVAALLLFFVKRYQRGSSENINVNVTKEAVATDEGFNRTPANIIYTKHARCRMECRHITEDEVKQIIATGKAKIDNVAEGQRGPKYQLNGRTKDDKMVRIVVAPKNDDLVIVTVMDLDTDWPCGDCK